jgi:hypothetical protein
MSPASVPIPSPGVLAGRTVLFHSLHDAAVLREDGSPTPFFQNPHAFEDGTHKLYHQECNLEGAGGGMPANQMKRLKRVVLHVQGAGPEDVFRVKVLASRAPVLDEDVRVGWGSAATVAYTTPEGKPLDYIDLLPQEMLEVFVTPPERFCGAYAQVSLWGPLTVSVEV